MRILNKKIVIKLLCWAFLLHLPSALIAGRERYSAHAATKINSPIMLTTNTVLIVQDPAYLQYILFAGPWPGAGANPGTTPGSFYDRTIKNRVTFSIDYSNKVASTADYTAAIVFNVMYSKYMVGPNAFQNFTQTNTLIVTSNQAAIDKDKAVYEFLGGNNLQVQVTGITFTSNPANTINLSNARLQLEAEIDLDRLYYFDPLQNFQQTNLSHCSADLATTKELTVYWRGLSGAEEYELEWVHINNYNGLLAAPYGTLAASAIPIDEKLFDFNCTRISTANNYYKIPYIYERGFILYRLRALGKTALSGWTYNIPGGWSTNMGVLGSPINVQQFVNKFPDFSLSGGCNTNENLLGLDELLNWQSSISYAEEGKSKAVVNYSDGSLRGRQSVTKLKSKGDVIIGETIYDFQGRPAINVLPVPSNTPRIEYTPNFNMVAAGNVFDAQDFDYDLGGNCTPSITALSTSSGAAKYYSPNNPNQANENAFIPDASGYPYTQTEFMPDNTGRIRNQSGVGATHTLTSGHETRYFYGTPEQKDLDRLFGSEVGDALRYKKNLVIDANGQPSITYLDPMGKTIATSLAGNNPANLAALNSQGSNLSTYDLLNKTLPSDNSGSLNNLDLPNKTLSMNKTILVPSNGPYTFTYEVKPPKYVENCGATMVIPKDWTVTTSGTKCYNCILDTKISLKNECGEELFTQIIPASTLTVKNSTTVGLQDTTCNANPNPSFSVVFTPTDVTNNVNITYLKPGSYVLEKSLVVNDAALDIYTRNYLDSAQNTCILKFSDFKKAQNAEMDASGCNITCSTCIAQLGLYPQYDITVNPTCTVCMTIDEYNGLLKECEEMCSEESSKCENALMQMLADMSPSGQYGQYSPGGGTDPNGNIIPPQPNTIQPWLYPLSVFNESNQLPVKDAVNSIFQANTPGVYSPSLPFALYQGQSSYYKPNWRHPYNPNESNVLKRFSYLDENKNIALVKLTPSGVNYLPAVSNLHTNKVVMVSGEPFIEPKYLQNLSDFLNAWETDWAYALIAYHPEACFYERCLADMPSNNFDAAFVETDKIVDIQNYMVSLGNSPNDFMYPVGTPPNTGTNCANWNPPVVDPYFKNTGNGFPQLCFIRNAMLKYMQDPGNPGTYITIWDAAYRVVHCPNNNGGLCPTNPIPPNYIFALDEEWQVFRGMYASLKQSFQDRVNTIYGMNSTCYNQCIGANPFDPFENNFYDPTNNVITYSPPNFFFWNNAPWNWNFWNWFSVQNISQYNNPEQTCNSNKHFLYSNKQARFPTMKMLMPDAFGGGGAPCYDDQNNIIPCPVSDKDVIDNMGNQGDLAMFQNCGQCPTAVNFQALFKGLVTLSTTVNQVDITNSIGQGVKLTCAPNPSLHKEFTTELAVDLFGAGAPITDVYWKRNTTNSTNLFLHATLTHNNTTTNVGMLMPSLIVPLSGIPGYTPSYAPFNNIYTFNDIVDVCCLKHNPSTVVFPVPIGPQNGVQRFTSVATVLCKTGDPLFISNAKPTYRQIVVEGYVQNMDFKNCNFNTICRPSKEIKRLQALVNGLLFKNPHPSIANTFLPPDITNINPVPLANANPYNAFMQPNLINNFDAVIAPFVDNTTAPWFWIYNQANSSNIRIAGAFQPLISSPISEQCTFTLDMPAVPAYTTGDLLKLTGIKPSSVIAAPAGAFTAYGLFKNPLLNNGNAKWVSITGTISCLSAGSCGSKVEGNFELQLGTGETIDELYSQPFADDGPPCPPTPFLSPLISYVSNIENFNNVNSTNLTFAVYDNQTPPNSCEVKLTMQSTEPYNFTFANINQFVNLVLLTPPSAGTGSFVVAVTATVMVNNVVTTQTILLNGSTSCGLMDCPQKPCTNFGNSIVNGDFEQGNYGFASDYTLTPGTSLAVANNVTPNYLPFTPTNAEKRYNVYPIKPAFNSNPPATTNVPVSDHTGVFYNNPLPTYFSSDIAGNGNALAGRSEINVDKNLGPQVGYVWKQYLNLEANKNYTFSAFFRGVPPFQADTNVFNGLVCEFYVDGNLVTTQYNLPNPNYPTLPIKSWKKLNAIFNSGTNSSNIELGVKIYYGEFNGNTLQDYNPTGRFDDLFLLDDIRLMGCMVGNSSACNIPPSFEEEPEDDCLEDVENTAFETAEYEYAQYMDSLRKNFRAKYIAKCLDVYEDFQMKANDSEHHYTLYYYDQAGNLVKTVPPNGVVKIPDNDPKLQQIKLDRKNNTQSVFTDHSYATNYKYNSLNQLVSQSVPDNKDLAIWNTNTYNGINPAYNVQSMAFNGSNGFAVANDGVNGYLYIFNPNTNSWTQIPSLNISSLNSVAYVNSTDAYAVGKNGTILKTTNNGNTWNIMPFSDGSAELLKVYQFDNTGLAIAYDKNGNSYLSNLIGTTWTKSNNVFGLVSGETLVDIEFNFSTGGGVAISNLNKIYTYNGTSWVLNTNNVHQITLNAVHGDGGSYMYAVGRDGTLLRSSNNGLNWTEIVNNLTSDLIDLQFYGSFNGYVLDNANKVYHTQVGGTLMSQLPTLNAPSSVIDIEIDMPSTTLYALNSNNNIHNYNGTIWSAGTIAPPVLSGANFTTIKPVNTTTIYAGGTQGVFKYYNGTNWVNVPTPVGFNLETVRQIDFKIVGLNILGYLVTQSNKIYYYDKNTTPSNPLTQIGSQTVYKTVFFNGTDGVAMLTSGQVQKLSGAALNGFPSGFANSNADFRSIYMNAANNMAAVGANIGNVNIGEISIGNPLPLTGNGYANKTGSTVFPTLTSVSTNASGSFISGNDGTVLRFNPSFLRWENMATGSNTQLNAITSSGANVVAAGKKGPINGSLDDVVYSANNGSSFSKTQNNIADINRIKIVGGLVYFVGVNRTITSANTSNPVNQVLVPVAPGTEKLVGITNDVTGNITTVGEKGLIYRGNNTGVTLQGSIQPPILNDIKWYDNNHVLAVGNAGQIIASDNAGVTWKTVTLTVPTGNDFNSVDILNPTTAIAVGDNNTIYSIAFTCAGPVCTYTASPYSLLPVVSANATDISIKNNNILIVYDNGQARYRVGLNAWQNISASPQPLRAVHMVDNTFAFAVGDNAALSKINLTALTVTNPNPVPTPLVSPVNLNDVYFKDYLIGYAVGNNGKIIKTTNGGISWTLESNPSSITNNNINTIVALGSNSFAVGANGGASGNAQDNKDEMSSRFYYDKLGRLIASQNSKQYASDPKRYSYTRYDNLGRITEVGEVLASKTIEKLPNTNNGQVDIGAFNSWLTVGGTNTPVFTEITRTYYDNAPLTLPAGYDGAGTFVQGNLRNRVAYTTYQDVNGPAFDHASYFSYDVHGNVDHLYQYNSDLPAGNKFKRTDYEYDLISGKVNNVAYQSGSKDQLMHSYDYDDDNRITNVFTSKDGVIYDQDAKYFYYRHGPLARTEIGDNKVQGMDYAYTLHGWIKGVNSDKLSHVNDQGHDAKPFSATSGDLNNFISTDAVGYHLGYFTGDYQSINTPAPANYFLGDQTGSPLAAATTTLYNGNISQAGYSIKKFIDLQGTQGYRSAAYNYDQLNRLVATANFDDFNPGSNQYIIPATANLYNEQFTYDANGNILTLKRKNETGANIDDLAYNYKTIANLENKNTNQLGAATDLIATPSLTYDIEQGQNFTPGNHNYNYDNIGNLVRDQQEEIFNIEWTVYGKIKTITRTAGSNKPDLEFNYDASGNRISKITKTKTAGILNPPAQWTYTYYERDAQGNILATYEKNAGNASTLFLTEQHLYGSSRVGVLNRNENMTTAFVPGQLFDRKAGNKGFELSNHLGNVITVVSDRKLQVDDGVYNNLGVQTNVTPDGTIDYYTPDIVGATDYYAFGMVMPNRQFNTPSYRYGFNGKENDNEVKGVTGSQQDYGLRIYDPRIGKFLSIDPLTNKYPFYSPYQFAGNSPIQFIDLDGAEPQIPYFEKFKLSGNRTALDYAKGIPNAATSIVNGGISIVNLALYNGYMYSTLGPVGYSKATASYWMNSEIPAAKATFNNTVNYFSENSAKQIATDAANKISSPEFFEGALVVAGSMATGGPKGGGLGEITLPIQEARSALARNFYEKFGESNIESKLNGINFNKPVQTQTLKAGTIVEQWQDASGDIGKYFAPVGSDPSTLGISGKPFMKQYTLTEDVKVLKSTASDFNGNKGGGTQYFNPSLKEKIKPVE